MTEQQVAEDAYSTIPLTQGQVAIVDTADYGWLSQFKWYAQKSKRDTFYAARSGGWRKPIIRMHREILGCIKGEIGDHKNRNQLDNRRHNLRKATPSQNSFNRMISRKSLTGIKGVHLHVSGKWQAKVYINGKRKTIGSFKTKEEAGNAYATAARLIYGEFACLG